MDKQLQLRAILLGGIIAGVLSSIPGVGMAVNCCCCGGFYTLAGFVTSYHVIVKTRVYISDGEAALTGLGAGILAGTISATFNGITQILTRPNPEEMMESMEAILKLVPSQYQDLYRQLLEQSFQAPAAPGIIMSMIMIVVLAAGAATLAAFIGIRLLRPLRTMAPLTPPTAYNAYYQQYPSYPPPWPPAATPAAPGYYQPAPAPAPAPVPSATTAPAAPTWAADPAPARPAEAPGMPWGETDPSDPVTLPDEEEKEE